MNQVVKGALTACVVVAVALIVRSFSSVAPSETTNGASEEAPEIAQPVANTSPPAAPEGLKVCSDERAAPDDCIVWVHGGEFLMGAQSDDPNGAGYDPVAGEDEGPVRRVRIDGFWLGRWEVLARYWHECVLRGECVPPDSMDPLMFNFPTKPDGVMNGVTYDEAAGYCARLGGRLPTEAEWEFAARGPASDRFSWGNDLHCANPEIFVQCEPQWRNSCFSQTVMLLHGSRSTAR